jgi:hypothetical protein
MSGVTRCLGVLVLALALTACGGTHSAAPQVIPGGPIHRVAAATQWVGTHGIEVAVPAAWKLGRGWCGVPQANTVLWNEDGLQTCLPSQPAGLSVVEFNGYLHEPRGWYQRHTTPLTVDGVRARRWSSGTVGGSHDVQLAFPGRGVSVAVLSPSRTLLRRILASVRMVRVDRNGCPTHPAPLFRRGSRRHASEPFVPAGAVGLIGCSYQGRWLDQSNRLGRRAAARLTRTLDEAPFGFSHPPHHTILKSTCDPTWRGSLIVVRLRYAGGRPSRRVAAHLIGCSHLGASNGRSGVMLRRPWVNEITRDARYFGASIMIPR